MTSAESLTIAIIPLAGGEALQRCLRATSRIPARHCLIGPDTAPTVPLRRKLAVEAATTPWIALIEDTCEPDDGWVDAFEEIASSPAGIAWGGPVKIANSLAPRALALACLEYGGYGRSATNRLAAEAGPGLGVPVPHVPGLNLLYRRDAIVGRMGPLGLVESELHEELGRTGEMPRLHPALSVTCTAADPRGTSLASRFAHGRLYGGGLAERRSPLQRTLGVLKCVLLPAVLASRAWRGMPREYGRPIAASLWIVAFATAWSGGELTGLVAGRGHSDRAWS